MTDIITQDGEVLTDRLPTDTAIASILARAEIDIQISTARAMPRSLAKVVNSILTLATLDDESAEECVYALPRSGKAIRGPSIRLAEIISSQWGNCRVGTRVVQIDRKEKFVEAEGVFHDLETNTATTARVRRRISDKNGKLFNDDMIIVTGNAACSIAKRNAILGAVPKAVWRKAYSAVEQVIAGDIKTLSERRDRAMKAFAAFGVTPDQVFAAIGIAGADDITLDHMAIMTGMHAALKNGEATVEEMFAKPTVSHQTVSDPLKDDHPGGQDGGGKVIENDETQESAGASPGAADGEAAPNLAGSGRAGDGVEGDGSSSPPADKPAPADYAPKEADKAQEADKVAAEGERASEANASASQSASSGDKKPTAAEKRAAKAKEDKEAAERAEAERQPAQKEAEPEWMADMSADQLRVYDRAIEWMGEIEAEKDGKKAFAIWKDFRKAFRDKAKAVVETMPLAAQDAINARMDKIAETNGY